MNVLQLVDDTTEVVEKIQPRIEIDRSEQERIAAAKIRFAKIRIIRYLPFFGEVLNRMSIVQNNSLPTMATDGFRIYYNSEFTEKLKLSEVTFIICHEILHNTLDHFTRKQHRRHHKFNIAADYALNPLLTDIDIQARGPQGTEAALAFPKDENGELIGLLDKQYYGMAMEKIYDLLPDQQEDKVSIEVDNVSGQCQDNGESKLKKSKGKGGSGSGSKLRPGDMISNNEIDHDQSKDLDGNAEDTRDTRSDTQQQDDMRKIVRDSASRTCGKNPLSIERVLSSILKANVPWQALLKRYLNTVTNKFEPRWKDARLATLGINIQEDKKTFGLGNVIIAIDTSGSITDQELATYLAETNKILRVHPIQNLYILCCDTEVKMDKVIHLRNPRKIPENVQIYGGGGTEFQPVFDWVQNHLRGTPDLLIYFTDSEGKSPRPVAWQNKVIWFIINDRISGPEEAKAKGFLGNIITINQDGNMMY